MNAITATKSPIIDKPEQAKAIRAGSEFEAVLLNAVFGGLQAAFTHLPGTHQSNSTKAYDGIAMQALTAGLSRSGGIGMGAFVTRWLEARQLESAGT